MKKPDLSVPDQQCYYRSYEHREDAILKAIQILASRNKVTEDEAEKAFNRMKLVTLENELDDHVQKKVAFNAGRAAINPPTPDQMDRLRDTLERVEQLTPDSRVVEQIVSLARENTKAFEAIHPSRQ